MTMASITATAGARTLRDRIGHMTETFKARYAQHRVYRTTLDELKALSERELADLGLHRSQLEDVARSAAYDI